MCDPGYSEIHPESDTAKQCLGNTVKDLECIVHKTVAYAKYYKNDLNFNLTVNKLKVFLGVSFFSSHHHLPQSKLAVEIKIPFVEQTMSGKIKSYLNICDNSICPFVNKANELFRNFEIFEFNLAVDEMIVKCFGHHGINL